MEMMQTAIAVEMFRRQKGRLPQSLGDMVPEYASQLPQDPFTGQPVTYQTTDSGYVLYSVGRDQVDDGGAMNDRIKQPFSAVGPTLEPDVVIRIEPN